MRLLFVPAGIALCMLPLMPLHADGQELPVTIVHLDSAGAPPRAAKIIRPRTAAPDSAAAVRGLRSILGRLYGAGFLAASIDSVAAGKDGLRAYLRTGAMYEWAGLTNGNVDEAALNAAGYRSSGFRNRPVSYRKVAAVQEKLLRWYENHGYPFAAVFLDSITIRDRDIAARLTVDTCRKIYIDSVIIRGSARVSPAYIYAYTGIRPGDAYNESLVAATDRRLKEIPFIKPSRPTEVEFATAATRLYLYLDHARASRFDGILGLLPDEETGKLQLTGDVKLSLRNAFRRGESMHLNWRQLSPGTQDLDAGLSYPFVLRSPFGIEAGLHIFRKDTLFLDVGRSLGLQFLLRGGNHFRAFVESRQTSALSPATTSSALPAFADVAVTLYGLGLSVRKLDYVPNPASGYFARAGAAIGTKTVTPPSGEAKSFDTLKLRSTQYRLDAGAGLFLRVTRRNIAHGRITAAYLYNEAALFENELYRIGGLRTLRGFDEESLTASSYAVFTVEYRYLLEENSYFNVFLDRAFYEKKAGGTVRRDDPYGFGAGVSFETKAGIFSVSYALGKQLQNPVQFRSARIHFGLVNTF